MRRRAKPIIGVLANHLVEDGVHRNWLRWKYIEAAERYAGTEVLLIPTQSQRAPREILSRLDGVILTGDESNLDPSEFGATASLQRGSNYVHLQRDRYRDRSAYCVLNKALDLGLPFLAICRGLQEMAVAFGGTLHERLWQPGASVRHHEDTNHPRDRQYDPVHDVSLTTSGVLHRLLGTPRIRVNSLHHQGIATIPAGLTVEATAPDGLVEAVSVTGASTFQLGVQWHPEWHADVDPISQRIFEAFGDACARINRQTAA